MEWVLVQTSPNMADTKWVLLGAQQNDVKAQVALPGTRSFCQAHAFEVLTPTSTYRQFIICMFYLLKFRTKQDFVFKYHIL